MWSRLGFNAFHIVFLHALIKYNTNALNVLKGVYFSRNECILDVHYTFSFFLIIISYKTVLPYLWLPTHDVFTRNRCLHAVSMMLLGGLKVVKLYILLPRYHVYAWRVKIYVCPVLSFIFNNYSISVTVSDCIRFITMLVTY